MREKRKKMGNVPNLRFKGFEGEWEIKKLGEVVKIYDGTHQTPNYVANGIPFYSVEHVTANQFENTRYISKDIFEKENERVKLEKGDILMTRIGSIGIAKYINWDVEASFYVSLALIKQSHRINNEYLFHYINSNFFQSELWKRTIHVAFPQKINLGEIGMCYLKHPLSDEQQKIAAFLSLIDERIATQSKIIQRLETLMQGLREKLFTQKLRFKDSNGSPFPDWEVKKLGEVCEINPKNSNLPNTFIYIDLESVVSGRLLKEEKTTRNDAPSRAQRVLKQGDVLFQMVRPYQKNNYYFDTEGDYVASTGYAQIRTVINSQFIFQLLHFQDFVDRVMERCTGTSYPAINSTDLSNIVVSVSSVPEQSLIANFLSTLDKKVDIEVILLQRLQSQKKYLLQNLFI